MEHLPDQGGRTTLRDDEAHHMVNVVRVRSGEEVVLFDGSGREARAKLVGADRREVELDILDVRHVDREPARKLILACALPRASRMDFLVEKCCELGVERLVPMVTSRSVVDPIERQQSRIRRWARISVEAAKQSGGTRLTHITPAVHFESALAIQEHGAARIIASPEPDGESLATFSSKLEAGHKVLAYVGPEGGFAIGELDTARKAGCEVVSLGPRILRVETAAVALAACLLLGES